MTSKPEKVFDEGSGQENLTAIKFTNDKNVEWYKEDIDERVTPAVSCSCHSSPRALTYLFPSRSAASLKTTAKFLLPKSYLTVEKLQVLLTTFNSHILTKAA